MFRLFSLLTILLLSCADASAAAVWKVSKAGNSLFIGGTMHLLSQRDYPLPHAYQQAYEASDILVFETDIHAFDTPEIQQRSAELLRYQDDRTLADELKPETLSALEQHLASRNVSLSDFMRFKPSMIYVTLSILEFQALGLTTQGVDQYYAALATKDNKPQQWLETPEQQLAFLAGLGEENPDNLISYTLEELKHLPKMLNALKSHWRSGDMEALAELGIEPLASDFARIYDDLIVTRNQNWLPAIEHMLSTDATEFVLVGALHLAGKDSVLKSLKDKGYQITRL